MKRLALFVLLTASTMALMASKHPSFPDAAYAAKTIYIDNQTGVQQTTDTVAEDLAKWGRLSRADDRKNADLIATFTKVSVLDKGTTIQKAHLTVTVRDASDPFYQDEEFAYGYHLENTRLGLSAGKCFEKFRGRLDDKK